MCMVVMVILMSAVSATLSVAVSLQSSAKSSKEADYAVVLAEAAVDRALFEMQTARDIEADGIGNGAGALGGGNYTVTCTPAWGTGTEYTLRGVGVVGRIRRGVQAVIARPASNVGFFGITNVRMSGGLVDSYDSSGGSYVSQAGAGHAGSNVTLGSNGNIDLSGAPEVWGNATPGPGYLVTGATAGVSGSTAPAAAPLSFASVPYAPPLSSSGAFSGTQTFTTGSYRYSTFTVPGGETATFSGTVELWVDGNFTISGSGSGVLSAGAKLVIHHGSGDFTISGGGIINSNQSPADLKVESSTTGDVTVSGSAAFFGSISAPSAAGIVSGSGGIYGAFTANSMNLSGGSNLHFDEALGSGGGAFEVRVLLPFKP